MIYDGPIVNASPMIEHNLWAWINEKSVRKKCKGVFVLIIAPSGAFSINCCGVADGGIFGCPGLSLSSLPVTFREHFARPVGVRAGGVGC